MAGVDNSVAVGSTSQARGAGSTAFGTGARSLRNNALSVGNNSLAQGIRGVAVGDSAVTLAENASALGASARAAHAGATAIGANAATSRINQVKLGAMGTSIALGDINASDAAQVGEETIVTVDADGTLGKQSGGAMMSRLVTPMVDQMFGAFRIEISGQIGTLDRRVTALENQSNSQVPILEAVVSTGPQPVSTGSAAALAPVNGSSSNSPTAPNISTTVALAPVIGSEGNAELMATSAAADNMPRSIGATGPETRTETLAPKLSGGANLAHNADAKAPEMIVEDLAQAADSNTMQAERQAQEKTTSDGKFASVSAEPVNGNGITRANLNDVPDASAASQTDVEKSRTVDKRTDEVSVSAVTMGASSTAVGDGVVAQSNPGLAVGNSAMAIGDGAMAFAPGALAIGPGAIADKANLVAIGAGGSTLRVTGISSSASRAAQSGPVRLVTADAAGNLATSLFNVSEISGLGQRTTVLEGQVSELFDLANVQNKNMRQGVALATARANPHFPSEAGKTSYASNIAYYRGEIGISASMMHRVDNDIAFSAGLAYGGGDNVAVSAGIAGEF